MTAPSSSTFVTHVVLKNYKSIAACSVALGPLTILVGPNGAGKSNFLDALRFVADALRTSLDHALRDRGGIHEVRRRSGGHPTHFGVRLDFRLPTGATGFHAFKIAAQRGGFEVQTEECAVGTHRYLVRSGEVVLPPGPVAPPAASDRLYLVNAAGLPMFRPVFDGLSSMGFYNLSPDRLRALQTPDKGDLLARDGSNLASVLDRLSKDQPAVKRRIEEYLARVVPGVEGIDAERVGHMETIEFRQRVEGAKDAWRFPAINMSDGTLRALGVLVALFQHTNAMAVPLVGIEEPEVALHPAAAGVLLDCLRDGSRTTQILITSHSPDLLDDPRLSADQLLAVSAESGRTDVGPLDEPARDALRDQLYTAGELLRLNQLQPDQHATARSSQLGLFDGGEAQ
ncbi:MAG: AAA family ATPase [Deltaproteobacteria bacterium]|nr:AAA family ATPase [Deltaproteobacteria bacterium]